MKTSKNRTPQTFLDGNELPFDVYLSSLSRNGKVYVTIEHANADTLENAKINHQKSIDYLLKNF